MGVGVPLLWGAAMSYLPPHRIFLQQDLQNIALRAVHIVMDMLGKSLPCHVTAVAGQIVTVAFDLPQGAPWILPEITLPVASSPYDYEPYQVGDTGFTVPADVYLGGISGLGGGQATWNRPGNLDALVFVPVGQQSFTAPNPNARIIQGPDGWIAQTTQGSTPCSIVGNQQGITLTYGGTQIVMNSDSISMTAGGQTVTLDSTGFNIGGILFESHEHSGVTTGSGNTGGPVAG